MNLSQLNLGDIISLKEMKVLVPEDQQVYISSTLPYFIHREKGLDDVYCFLQMGHPTGYKLFWKGDLVSLIKGDVNAKRI